MQRRTNLIIDGQVPWEYFEYQEMIFNKIKKLMCLSTVITYQSSKLMGFLLHQKRKAITIFLS